MLHRRQSLPFHPNGMRFYAYGADGSCLRERTYYSVGGGFVVDEQAAGADRITEDATPLPHPFLTGDQLLEQCRATGLLDQRGDAGERARLAARGGGPRAAAATSGRSCSSASTNGCSHPGTLPGGLKVPRRAPELYERLCAEHHAPTRCG